MTHNEPSDDSQPLELYRRLWEADLDEVHELIADHGPQILTHGRPYLLTALKRRGVSRWRRDERRSELEREAEAARELNSEPADPPSVIEAGEVRDALRAALNNLPTDWLLVVWRRAEGRSYQQIAREWVALDFRPPPTEARLRQIYHRAVEQLRGELTGP